MRGASAVIVVAITVAACGSTPTQPESDKACTPVSGDLKLVRVQPVVSFDGIDPRVPSYGVAVAAVERVRVSVDAYGGACDTTNPVSCVVDFGDGSPPMAGAGGGRCFESTVLVPVFDPTGVHCSCGAGPYTYSMAGEYTVRLTLTVGPEVVVAPERTLSVASLTGRWTSGVSDLHTLDMVQEGSVVTGRILDEPGRAMCEVYAMLYRGPGGDGLTCTRLPGGHVSLETYIWTQELKGGQGPDAVHLTAVFPNGNPSSSVTFLRE